MSEAPSSAAWKIVEDCARAERLRCTREAPDLDLDVVARGDRERERQPGGEPKLVDAMDVGGVGDRNVKLAVHDRVGNRDGALEHVERDLLCSLLLDRSDCEID